MKSKLIIMGLAIVATSMFSCKKEYTCKCERVYKGDSTTVTRDDDSYVFKDNEARASDKCNAQEGTGTDLYGDYSKECTLD